MKNVQGGANQSPELIRGISLAGATSLNMIDMIGVGPFITIPLIIAAMGGPQAMLGWIIGAALVICDGLVWAELGAAMPGSGVIPGTSREIYNPASWGGDGVPIWQLSFSAPLSIASGCIGLAQYAGYLVPSLGNTLASNDFVLDVPLIGTLNASIIISTGTFVAMGACLTAVALLYRKITIIAKISGYLWVGVMLTIGWIIFAGLTHFDAGRAFSFPQNAFELNAHFFNGLGAGMLVAVYDYWGYYNVCFLGGEIRDPGRTIPRAILLSIGLVAVIYIVMNISILGVIPWQELGETATSDARKFIVSVFMQRVYGEWAGALATILIMWTAFASVFSLLLGYSRIPYAAAVDGDYFAAVPLSIRNTNFLTFPPRPRRRGDSLLPLPPGGYHCRARGRHSCILVQIPRGDDRRVIFSHSAARFSPDRSDASSSCLPWGRFADSRTCSSREA
jgi:amino acid transporter